MEEHTYTSYSRKDTEVQKPQKKKRTGFNCAVVECPLTNADGVSLHCFPTDPKQRNNWIRFVQTRRRYFSPTCNSRICEKHFLPSCYPDSIVWKGEFGLPVGRKLLKQGAVPTIQKHERSRPTSGLQPKVTLSVPTTSVVQCVAGSMVTAAAATTSVTSPISSTVRPLPGCTLTGRSAFRKRERSRIISEILDTSMVEATEVTHQATRSWPPVPMSRWTMGKMDLATSYNPKPTSVSDSDHWVAVKIEVDAENVSNSVDHPSTEEDTKEEGAGPSVYTMEEEDSAVVSEVKIELDIAEEPYWMTEQQAQDEQEAQVDQQAQSEQQAHDEVITRTPHDNIKVETDEASVECDCEVKTEPDDEMLHIKTENQTSSSFKEEWDQASCPFDHTDQPCSFQPQKDVSESNGESDLETDPVFSHTAMPHGTSSKDLSGEKHSTIDCANELGSNASSLNSDVKNHKQSQKRKHACDVCNRAFTLSGDLNRHKLIHTGQRNFVCTVCKTTFAQASTLKTHMLVHTGQRNFVCDVCNKAFTLAGNLASHKLIHSAQKNHVCDVCSKAFTQAAGLYLHKLIHTGQKNHVCDFCNKAFSRPSKLKRHQLTHK